MKNLYIFLLLLVGVGCFGQAVKEIDSTKAENIFDHYGNQYSLSDIKIRKSVKSATNRGALLCSTAMFNLYFDPGSGMETVGNALHDARRAVVCQVFNDLTNFINSPLKNPSNSAKVNIWVRNINQVSGVPTPASTSNVLGLASSFYTLERSANNLDVIADGEIWKTINSGQNSYINGVFNEYVPLQPFGVESSFYHGMIAFNFDNLTNNWNTNMFTSAPADSTDLYTTVLHEVTHALGFVSLINFNGKSRFSNNYQAYSRYDKFLKDGNNNFLITNNSNCSMYNYGFNPSSNISVLHPGCTLPNGVFNGNTDNTVCGTAVQYTGRSTVPVYTPICYENGSSLSHFEDELYPTCNPTNDNVYFVMSNALGNGNTKRFLKTEERNALLDIGYSVNLTYGNVNQNSYFNYNSSFTNDNIVAGANDGINNIDKTYTFAGNMNQDITINGILNNDFTNLNAIDFNTNDLQNLRFECLEILPSFVFSQSTSMYVPVYNGTLSANSGDSNSNITFRSNKPGLYILKYVPYNVITNKRGNITYIQLYVFENFNNCSIVSQSNIVYNGNFEQYSSLPNQFSQLNKACGWKSANNDNGTPDYFHFQTPSIEGVGIPCNFLGSQNVSNGIGNAYSGMFSIGERYVFPLGVINVSESIVTKLVSPLLPNTTYQLCFDISQAEAASLYAIKFQAYFSKFEIPTAGYGDIPIVNPAMLFTNSSFSLLSDDGSDLINGWQKVSFTFTTGSVSGEQFLYLGGLSNVQYQLRTPGTVSNVVCYQTNYNTDYPNSNKATYYYLDNVSLLPFFGPKLNLPNVVCGSTVIPNLASFLTPTVSGGTFSGIGVVNNNGVYSFNASIARLGSHTITYLNNLGCGSLATDIITVVASSLVPTFTQVAPICSGSPISLQPISLNNVPGTWTITNTNTTTVTYLFTPNPGECATTATMTIVITPSVTPEFNAIAPVCAGTVIPALQTTSINNIVGTWSPALDNTVTKTYTFVPTNPAQCATNVTLTITILPANDPACSNCQPNLTLTTPEMNTTILYQRKNWIETNSSYTTVVGQNIVMKAGDYINWKPNTRIVSGTVLSAKIETCGIAPIVTAPISNTKQVTNKTASKLDDEINAIEGVNIHPNPTENFVTVTAINIEIKSIIINSMEGKTVYLRTNNNQNEYLLDLSNYQKGIYILSVETSDGKTIRKKLVKN